jgi:hypothetical protein
VRGLPVCPVDGHIPARQCLGCRGRVSAPDTDGWREILPGWETRLAAALVEPRPKQLPQAWRIPAELHDRCFNCLSYSHRVATCQLPRHCLRCHGLHHIARECKRQPRCTTTTVVRSADLPQHLARGGKTLASQHAYHGGHRARTRPRRVLRGTLVEYGNDADDDVDNAGPSVATHCFTEPDPWWWCCARVRDLPCGST